MVKNRENKGQENERGKEKGFIHPERNQRRVGKHFLNQTDLIDCQAVRAAN
jgi:hypothetical protein